MNTNCGLKIYLVLILFAGVGLALTLPILAGAQASTRGDPLSPAAANGIFYVAKSGDGSDGLSWTTAYTDLQDALGEAVSGDQVWVARGVYTPGVDIIDTFTLTADVQLYGGFDPETGADQFSERDWEAYPTILSGDIGGDDSTDAYGVVTTTDQIMGDNSYHVVRADGTSIPITGSTVLDGFIITAGQANSDDAPDYRGGGYYCDGSDGGECSPSLENVTFTGNSAKWGGGAMHINGYQGTSNPTLTNVTFSGNSAYYGGGLANSNSNPYLENVNFTGNSAEDDGGAIFNSNSSPNLSDVTFAGNSAASSGGAMFTYSEDGTSSPTLTNVTFTGNSAGSSGGAMGNFTQFGTCSPILINVTFTGNSAGSNGGAMYSSANAGDSSPSLNNVILWGNTAVISGSQLYNSEVSVAITTSLVQGGIDGSGVYNQDSTVIDGGGNLDADPKFVRDPDPGPDGDWDGVDDDYGDLHLQQESPAIDSGSNSAINLPSDLDGQPRIVDGDGDGVAIVDMGAYEYNCPAGSILYVDHTASGAGGSWLEAKADLALGLKLLNYCPQVSQVWVATGVYTSGVQQSDSFELVPGVAVYGGFDPTAGADQFSERDWQSNPTILSGDIAGDDIPDAHGVVTTTGHIVGGNNYHVVMADATSTAISDSTALDGFTITAGQANGFLHSSGGGFYCDGSGVGAECSPSLRDVTFSGNYASYYGGAMYNYGSNGVSNPTLTNVTFSGNYAYYSGGAMYNYSDDHGTSSPSLSDVTFAGNSAGWGGAMYNDGSWRGTSSPNLNNVIFSGNSARRYGGAMCNTGMEGSSSPTVTNVTFSGNSAGEDGGAMYNTSARGSSSPSLANVTFSGNSADRGGAIYNDTDPNFGNTSPNLTNVTFSGNTADYGGAMYNDGSYYSNILSSLSNVILWGNTAEINGSQLYNLGARVTITTSLVQDGITGGGVYNDDYSTITDGGGNLEADPEFVRAPDPGPDGSWDGVDDNYGDMHLGASSPAIDSGTNSAISLPTDLDGNPRIVDGDMDGTATVDMGAYEFQLVGMYLPLVFR